MNAPDPTPVPPPDDTAEFLLALGRRVRLARERRGWSRKALSHESHVSERYLAQLETGEGNPIRLWDARGGAESEAVFLRLPAKATQSSAEGDSRPWPQPALGPWKREPSQLRGDGEIIVAARVEPRLRMRVGFAASNTTMQCAELASEAPHGMLAPLPPNRESPAVETGERPFSNFKFESIVRGWPPGGG